MCIAVLSVVRARVRADVERDYAAMVACLVGPERVTTVAEAEVRMRRLALVRTRDSTERCAQLAREVGATRARRLVHARLAQSADETVDALDGRTQLPLLQLVANTRGLRWPRRARDPEVPRFILDEEIVALRGALPRSAESAPEPITRTDEFRRYLGASSLVVESGDRGPWSATRWESAPRAPLDAYATSGIVHVRSGSQRRDVGAGEEAAFIGDRLLIRRGHELSVRRGDGLDVDAGEPLAVPDRARLAGTRACALGGVHVLALGGGGDISILALDGERLTEWGSVRRAPLIAPDDYGPVMLTCERDAVRVAYAISHAGGPAPECCTGGSEFVPAPTRHHGIVSARCDVRGCTQEESIVRGIETGWEGLDPFRRDPRWIAPDVVVLGERVLVVWNGDSSVRYRIGRLDELDSTETRWLVETLAPETEVTSSPRCIAHPSIVLRARGDVGLLELHEGAPLEGTFLLRFEGDGPPTVLVPAPR